MNKLPRWAKQLLEDHPDGEMPTRDNPVPAWLAEETSRTPLWYIIREAQETRTEHPFVLYREIKRQPDQWADIADAYWPEVQEIARVVVDRGIQQIITTGCGSAMFTAMHGEFVMPRFSGLSCMAVESYELVHYFPNIDPASTMVIGHSGTGGSIETVEAMEEASRRGVLTLALTNTSETAVERASDLSLTYVTRQECGPCISVVSTRAMLATMLAVAIGELRAGDPDRATRTELAGAADIGRAFLAEHEPAVRELARRFADASSWMVVGGGPHYFSAREGTLKIEEQANLIGKALRPGDFHHDALSVLGGDRPVVAIEGSRAANYRIIDVIRAANEGGSPTVAVTWSDTPEANELATAAEHHLPLGGGLSEFVSPVPLTLAFQLLGYYLAVARGRNPDTLMTDHEANTRAWLTSFPLGTH